MPGVVESIRLPLASPVSVAILDHNGVIVEVNEAWKNFGRRNGLRIPKFAIGSNYLDYCGGDGGSDASSGSLKAELVHLLETKINVVTRLYPCDSPTARRWFFLVGLPFARSAQSGAALLHLELTPFIELGGARAGSGVPRAAKENVSGIDLAAVAKTVELASVEALSKQVSSMLDPHQGAESEERAAQRLALAGLSKRQVEILGLLAEGKSNSEIAAALSRSPNTVKLHISAILKRLNLNSRTQAALLASEMSRAGPGARASQKPGIGRAS